MVRSRSAAVGLEDVLQALLGADVLLRGNAEIGDGDGSGEINSRQQPANGDGEESEDAEEDEQAAGTARDTNHQNRAQEQQEREESQRDGPSQQLVKLVFVDERLEQLIGLRRLNEIESGFNSTDGFGRVFRNQLRGVHHDRERGGIRYRRVPKVIDIQRQRLVFQRFRQIIGLKVIAKM